MTIVRWTGRGEFEDLRSGIARILDDVMKGIRLSRIGSSLLVEGPEPASVASMLRYLPGVSWLAVGKPFRSMAELGDAALWVAGRYIRRGSRFSVEADATGGAVQSDVAGAVTSAILGKVDGARLANDKPGTVIRCAFDGRGGAVGAELHRGPGGTPTGVAKAICLVSGGRHSSVTAWFALLAGYRVRLVHTKVDDESLRAVARLYSELSHRSDFSKLELAVLDGGSLSGELKAELSLKNSRVFGGFHSGCSEIPSFLKASAEAPLFLAPEEYVDREYKELGIRESAGTQDWGRKARRNASRWTLAGVRTDVSGVIDGLARQKTSG